MIYLDFGMRILIVTLCCATALEHRSFSPVSQADSFGTHAGGMREEEEHMSATVVDCSFREDDEGSQQCSEDSRSRGPNPRQEECYDSMPSGYNMHVSAVACASCLHNVDMRCGSGPAFNWCGAAYFHRIVNCMLPHYGTIEGARKAKSNQCIIAHKWLIPVLSPLVADFSPQFVDPKDPCVKKLKFAIDPEIKAIESDTQWAKRVPIQALRRDALRLNSASPVVRPYILLVTRRGGSRKFDQASENILREGLGTLREVMTYDGSETPAETFVKFRDADAVVGYHGAGFANTVFTARQICILEITTYANRDFSDKNHWRSNQGLQNLGTENNLKWMRYAIPIRETLRANNISPEKFETVENVDHFIKTLEFTGNLSKHAKPITNQIAHCLEELTHSD